MQMTAHPQTDLLRKVDLLRQMVLLALGANHPYYRSLDAAWQSHNVDCMQKALDEFDSLPEDEKNYTMGMDHFHSELTGSD